MSFFSKTWKKYVKVVTKSFQPWQWDADTFNPLADGLFAQTAPITLLMEALNPTEEPDLDDQADREQIYKSAVASRRMIYGVAKVGGVLVFAEDSGSKNEYRHLAIAVAAHSCYGIPTIWINDVDSTDSAYTNKVWTYVHLGADDQAADQVMVDECDHWTANHRLRGITWVHIKYLKSAFPDNITSLSYLVYGKNDIYDSRTGLTGWTDNWALCCNDWFLTLMKCTAGEVDNDLVEAAATVSDQNVVSNAAGTETENRYTCNGAIDLKGTALEGLGTLLKAGAGYASFSGGVWRLFAGAYSAPVANLDEDDLFGGITFVNAASKASRVNTVRGTFYDPDGEYAKSEFPVMTSSSYKTIDGEELVTKLHLGLTNSASACQRIAKILMERSRRGLQVTFPAKYTTLPLQPVDRVTLTIDRLGWDRVMMVKSFGGGVTSGLSLGLIEDAPEIYDWVPGDIVERTYPALTNLDNPRSLQPPASLTLTEYAEFASDGTLQVSVVATWDESPSSLVDYYEIQWRWSESMEYISATVPVDTLSYRIGGLIGGTDCDVRVRSVNVVPFRSYWFEGSISLLGLPGVPVAPSNLAAATVTGGVELTWTNNAPDEYIQAVAIYEATTNDRSTASLIDRVIGTRYYRALSSGVSRYYWILAISKAQQLSAWHPASETGGLLGTAGSSSDGADGADGQGVVKGLSFLRASSTPATPTGGSFASPTATGWSDGVPTGTNPLYMTTRIFTSDGLSPQQAVWTAPQLISQIGQSTKVQFSVDGSTSWHDTPTTNDQYMRKGTSTDGGSTWTYAGAVKIKGETGDTGAPGSYGADGQSVNIIFQRAATQPSTPASSSGVPSGWYDNVGSVPAGTNPIWSSVGTRASTTSNWVWQTPVKIVVEGDLANMDRDDLDFTDGADVTGDNVSAGVQTATFNKRVVIVDDDNEVHFYGDRGDGTIEELTTIGIREDGTDRIIIFAGSENSSRTAMLGIATTSNPANYFRNFGSGAGLWGYSGSGDGVFGGSYGASGSGVRGQAINGSYCYGLNGSSTYVGVLGSGSTNDFYAFHSSYGPFTGSHEGLVPVGFTASPGDIIVDISPVWKKNICNAICLNGLSSAANQAAVVGVLVSIRDLNPLEAATSVPYPWEEDYSLQYQIITFNALGEGLMNVVAEGGDIAVGDLICSSSTSGKGMKQSDDIMRSCTVAKSREAVTWTAEELAENAVKQIACTYHCG